jgi:hypothetical protein
MKETKVPAPAPEPVETVEIPVPVKPEDGTVIMGGQTFHRSVDSEWPLVQSLYYLSCRTIKSEDAAKYYQGTIDYIQTLANELSTPATETTPADICPLSDVDVSTVMYTGLHRKETFTGCLADAFAVAIAVRDINAIATAAAPARSRMTSDADKPETKTDDKPAASTAPVIAGIARKPAPVTA